MARRAFHIHGRLFHFRQLNTKIKIICYQLLVRSILVYGCPIWFNISASQMEKLRFERRCLRACLNMYKNPETDYVKYFSNKKIYDKANVPRIDSFIINLTRDYFKNASKINQNSLIYGAFYLNPKYYEKTLNTGYISSEAFLYFANGYIQDTNSIPTIYHIPRHKNTKEIKYPRMLNCITDNYNLKYSMALPIKNKKITYRNKVDRYWWLK